MPKTKSSKDFIATLQVNESLSLEEQIAQRAPGIWLACESGRKFFETRSWPETQARIKSLFTRGFQQRSDLELNIGQP